MERFDGGSSNCFYIHLKFYNTWLHLHSTILSNYYTNTTGTGPQGAKDNDYLVAINIKTCKYQKGVIGRTKHIS